MEARYKLLIVLLISLMLLSKASTQEYEIGMLNFGESFENSYSLHTALGKLFIYKHDSVWASNGVVEGAENLGIKSTTGFLFGNVFNDKLFLYGEDYVCYTSDGTASGTERLSDSLTFFNPYQDEPPVLNDKLYFFGQSIYTEYIYLCRTDGTAEGTEVVFKMGNNGVPPVAININMPFILNNQLYFFALEDNEATWLELAGDLWKTDGTLEGTQLVKDFSVGNDSTYIGNYHPLGYQNLMFFNRLAIRWIEEDNTQEYHYEIWTSDGTEQGTTLFDEGSISLYIKSGHKLFIADEEAHLACINENLEGLISLTDTNNLIFEMNRLGDGIIANIMNDELGSEAWVSDGTVEGTHVIQDTNGDMTSFPANFLPIENRVIYTQAVTPPYDLWISDGTDANTFTLGNFESIFDNPGFLQRYRGKIYFHAISDEFGGNIFFLNPEPLPNIKGKVFHDLNENGIWEENEPGIPSFPILVNNGLEQTTFTNIIGEYQISLREGEEYSISYLDQSHCWVLTSDIGFHELNLNDTTYCDINFGFRKLQGLETAFMDVQSNATRCGFTVPFWFNVYSTGCEPISGQINIELDEDVTFVSHNQDNVTVDGQNIVWQFEDIEVDQSEQLKLMLTMPGTWALGDTIAINANLHLLQNDTLSLVQEYAYTSEITCAYDPNDKQTFPSRPEASNSNYTQLDEYIQYTVRFQNTGNDTAFTVRIVDQLSPDLDWNTLEPLSASHPYRTTLFPDGELEFLFEDILLPDSTTNEPESHGYVTFRMKAYDHLEDLTIIENTANIYFDYNPAIVTNTVNNTLVEYLDFDQDGYPFWEDCEDENPEINPTAEDIPNNGIDEDCDGEDTVVATNYLQQGNIRAYPNPTSGFFHIENTEKQAFIATVYTNYGELLFELSAQNNARVSIDLSAYPAGMYILKLWSASTKNHSILRVIRL